jgi:hypothetical protein
MNRSARCRSQSYDDLRRLVVRGRTGATAIIALGALAVSACVGAVRSAPPSVATLPPLPFATDTVRASQIAPGVAYQYVHSPTGPWAIHLLRVNRDACWSFRAVKAHDSAIGRATTSALLRQLADSEQVIAGVNADFFSFTPPGVPTGAHVQSGQVITGPGTRPVIAFDSAGTPFIGSLGVTGSVSAHGESYPLAAWNRPASRGLALIDHTWGASSDTGSGRVEIVIDSAPGRVLLIDTLPAGVEIPPRGELLMLGREADADVRRAMLGFHVGDTVIVARTLTRPHLRDVVGGWPVILRDSAVTGAADSTGATFAPVRHPRTAIGLARGGHEIILAVVDGRQKPYSDGMTLRELAELFRALGARDALNLDGGGSSTFVLADSANPSLLEIRNRPSDKTERAVGNALAVVRGCAR